MNVLLLVFSLCRKLFYFGKYTTLNNKFENHENKLILLLAVLFLCSAFKADKPVITIFMIGDSTMANKSLTGGNPERGWGHVLPGFFSEDIQVDNHAMNGRSSKSFINEGRWDKVLSLIKKEIMFYPVRT